MNIPLYTSVVDQGILILNERLFIETAAIRNPKF